MAQYKVPQDVEADDKLLGPFSFRQLIYLFIAGGLGALAFGLFQLFPLLVIIPLPFIFFFLILALPLKKDQPMETYLAALVSFYLKPNKRFWNPGQRDSTITITAPKKVEGPRIRTISEDEASHRLSFLADIVDSEGLSVTGSWNGMKDEYIAEASATPDMFEAYDSRNLSSRLSAETDSKHAEAVEQMRAAIERTENLGGSSAFTVTAAPQLPTTPVIQPTPPGAPAFKAPTQPPVQQPPKPQPQESENPAKLAAMQQLSKNTDYSVATLAKEANRIQNSNDNEVFISLH